MYKVKETFEYLVDNEDKFLSVEDVLYMVANMTCPLWDGDYPDLPVDPLGNVEYNPWGGSDITITDLNSKVNIDKNTLLQLIKDSEKLSALEAEGVDNWEGYNLAIRELNTGYQKDAITDEVLIKQYCK